MQSTIVSMFSVSQLDIDKAETYQNRNGGRIESILVNMGCLTDEDLAPLYCQILNHQRFDPSQWQQWDPKKFKLDDIHFLQTKQWVLLATGNKHWTLACKDPLDLEVIEFIQKQQVSVEIHVSTDSELQSFLFSVQAITQTISTDDELSGDEETRLRELALEAPTVNLLNSLITKALARGASDMH
jgi:general secretion pathway protein E